LRCTTTEGASAAGEELGVGVTTSGPVEVVGGDSEVVVVVLGVVVVVVWLG
jgi:hypothetical protein